MMTPNVAGRITGASTQESTVLLEVKHLNVDYETGAVPAHAVNDVSFTLHRGQILGLAGAFLSTRSQQYQVACHLYSQEGMKDNE